MFYCFLLLESGVLSVLLFSVVRVWSGRCFECFIVSCC